MDKTHYIKDGNTFFITDNRKHDVHDHLPPATYLLLQTPTGVFYLNQVETLAIPNKIYGNPPAHVDRIYHTFSTRTRNTGVLLNGEKGSGKTLTLALLSHECIKNGVPVILINTPFCGDEFNKFISEISQPCMISFDEFDKTYDDDDQVKILTLLDGVFNSTKLFILTCNDSWRINGFMLNRPGRIFYNIAYKRLEEKAIRDYCNDNLNNKDHIEGVVTVSNTIDAFNFDMLKALVEEMNRYKETAKQAVSILNIRPERSASVIYKFLVSKGDKVLAAGDLGNGLQPLSGKPFRVDYTEPNPEYDANDPDCYHEDVIYSQVMLNYKDMTSITSGGYVFEKDGVKVTILKEDNVPYSYGSPDDEDY